MPRGPAKTVWITPKEYAESRQYALGTVQGWCRKGTLKKAARKKGQRWQIHQVKADTILGVSLPTGDGRESMREYAARSGESVENIRSLIKRGKLKGAWEKNDQGHYRIDPEAADLLRAGKRRGGEQSEPEPGTPEGEELSDRASHDEAKRVEAVWKARTARQKHLEAEGELINKPKARNALFAVAKELRERLGSLVVANRDRLAAIDDPDEIEAVLADEHNQALMAFTDILEKGALA